MVKWTSPLAAFAMAFILGAIGGCQCGGTGYENQHYACGTDRDCIEGFTCVAGYCEPTGSADAGCAAVAEVCDNDVDENCNGVLDDGCPCSTGGRPCFPEGLDSPALRQPWDGGAGCSAGVQACAGGKWAATCEGAHAPQLEFCDGADTDCDGLPDPITCPCQQGRACYQGLPNTVNLNPQGKSTCRVGKWDCTTSPGVCAGQVLPAARDTCDGFDEDCNGLVDDLADTDPCGPGLCSSIFKSCVNGTQPACDLTTAPGYTATEQCGDGIDNNCNNQIEEGCSCVLDAGISCWTGSASECPTDGGACKGICRRGTSRCQGFSDGGQGYGACTGAVQAQTESCSNSLDDDCDGLTDCADSSCSGRSCNTTGKICSGGSCQCVFTDGGTVQTSETLCADGVDNDCDGLVDCAESACAGQSCGSGKICSNGLCTTADGGTPQVSESICNDGFDNDGDGQTDCQDQGCVGRTCAPNGFDCFNLQCLCNPSGGPVQTTETACTDGADNDCDGFTDCNDSNCITDAGLCVAEADCTDGQDNDLDGRTDCADTDCLFKRCSSTVQASVCCGPFPAQPNTATCINTGTDPNNCGGCGTVCSSGACNPVTGNGQSSGRCTCPSGDGGQCPVSPSSSKRQSCQSFTCSCDDDDDKCSKNRGQSCTQISGADFCYY